MICLLTANLGLSPDQAIRPDGHAWTREVPWRRTWNSIPKELRPGSPKEINPRLDRQDEGSDRRHEKDAFKREVVYPLILSSQNDPRVPTAEDGLYLRVVNQRH